MTFEHFPSRNVGSVPDIKIRIYPFSKILPANILRFYIHFSRPAEAHFDRKQLWLLNDKEQVIHEPFLVLSQELWSLDGLRLTILMEPGRIKRGLGTGPAHDPAFVVGQTYSLVVTVLGHSKRHVFHVSDPVLKELDESCWRLISPVAGSFDPVILYFERVMDAALLENEIGVLLHTGEVIQAQVLLAQGGTAAQIIPTRPWRAEEHFLVASERLEDVCGNRLGEALDHDLMDRSRPRAAAIKFIPRTTK